jgi:hypothetical protein
MFEKFNPPLIPICAFDESFICACIFVDTAPKQKISVENN